MSITTHRSFLPDGNTAAVEALRAALGREAVSTRELDRMALAIDASHYMRTPDAVMRAKSAKDVGAAMAVAAQMGWALTLRGGASSLSGQSMNTGLAVDVRRHFRGLEILDGGERVRVQPGLTIREVNSALSRYGRKLGPDPASEIACTIGGMIANNSSGMTCGTVKNTYQTIESVVVTLPSGTTIDTGSFTADDELRAQEPELVEVLERLRDKLREDRFRSDIQRRYAIKNTMGYGLNSFLDFDTPAKILEHLLVGSEGTLGFISEAVLRTVPIPARTATSLLLFDDLDSATAALPDIVYSGADVVELIDAASMRSMGQEGAVVLPEGFVPDRHASLLVEYEALDDDGIMERIESANKLFGNFAGLSDAPELTRDAARRADMWIMRKGLYTKVAGNRPKGTAALLEDVAVPMESLGGVCSDLQVLFDQHGYADAVIFGHAKDGNIHFLVTEDFAGTKSLQRFENFTGSLVDLILGKDGTLKAEHGTGRIMAPFVERQYGPELYSAMKEIKDVCDPNNIMNPGTIILEDEKQHLRDIKSTEPVRTVIDDCVECGYCEPVCPSQHLTTTPRQRIVIQRAIASAEAQGDIALAERLIKQQGYDVIQTCAVDGMCETACPMKINTGDLIRDIRREQQPAALDAAWKVAADHWSKVLGIAKIGMNTVDVVPTPLVRGALGVARAAIGKDVVPTLTSELPRGGEIRKPEPASNPDAIFLPACVGTMFGTEHACGTGVAGAVRQLAQAANLTLSTPAGVQELCCGTPWKSKGLAKGYDVMKKKLSEWIVEHTKGGELPLVCDNVSCTEGIITALKNHGVEGIEVVDATEWVAKYVAPMLPPVKRASRAVVHPTCSSTRMAVNDSLMMLAGLVAEEAKVPVGWRCCAFAGDRGLLHEELTATSTRDEAASVKEMDAELHLSLNRTCELGLTRATGETYVHVLEELAARVQEAMASH